MLCVAYKNSDEENAFWEGLNQGHEVTNLLIWKFSEEIIHATVNYPGSWHYSTLYQSQECIMRYWLSQHPQDLQFWRTAHSK